MADYTRHIYHQLHHCLVYSWLAEGHIKLHRHIVQEQFFLYTEYRDKVHASQYTMFSFSTLQEALTFQTEQLAYTKLSHIDPDMTQQYPIPGNNTYEP